MIGWTFALFPMHFGSLELHAKCLALKCSRAKTVNENLKMNAALLSRFDLVFILLDKPDELLDKRLSEHIMSVSFASLSV